jgi:hypothetical protein
MSAWAFLMILTTSAAVSATWMRSSLISGEIVAYTQARTSKLRGTRYTGFYRDADGKLQVAGTFATSEEALRVAQEQDHVRARRGGTPPAEKATIMIDYPDPRDLTDVRRLS